MGLSHVKYAEENAPHLKHYKTYTKCQSEAFVYGMMGFVSGGATIYVGQEVIKRFAPINQNAKLFAPVFGGALVSYLVTRRKTTNCQKMWLALEERHSPLHDLERGSGSAVEPGGERGTSSAA
ncbi:hypothetical protein LSAT2_010816 [Lamellibrachia satsuma]|nr:hypothetical protein LSAT2_010816 [Lamellibrachia satsuma]